jgi:hypothetical protein
MYVVGRRLIRSVEVAVCVRACNSARPFYLDPNMVLACVVGGCLSVSWVRLCFLDCFRF